MNLIDPLRTMSIVEKLYILIVVDDFSRFTWAMFLAHKNEAFLSSFKYYTDDFKMTKKSLF